MNRHHALTPTSGAPRPPAFAGACALAALAFAGSIAGCNPKLEGAYRGTLEESVELSVLPVGFVLAPGEAPPKGVDVPAISSARANEVTVHVTREPDGSYRLDVDGCRLRMRWSSDEERATAAGVPSEQNRCEVSWSPRHPKPVQIRFAGTARLEGEDALAIELEGVSTAGDLPGGQTTTFRGKRVE